MEVGKDGRGRRCQREPREWLVLHTVSQGPSFIFAQRAKVTDQGGES